MYNNINKILVSNLFYIFFIVYLYETLCIISTYHGNRTYGPETPNV
jgi:hypothetical protein